MSSDERAKVQIDLVDKVTSQIITLSSAIIVVLVTILGYYYEYSPKHSIPYTGMLTIFLSGVFFLGSIFFGLVVYGALISSLDNKSLSRINMYESPLRYVAILQWLFFAIGIVFLILSLYQVTLMTL